MGRFLRLWVSDLVSRIYIDDMSNVDEVRRMCEDIFLARQYGDLLLEEQLFQQLISLFRTRDRLFSKTTQKQKIE